MANGENAPLTNRVTSAYYRPGSTFKTVTATAALNEGIITPTDTVTCKKYYTYWEGWSPECTGYHGRLNVVEALRESCNIFFYDVGRITGIDLIAQYASDYGLGGEMGLEIGRGVKKATSPAPRPLRKEACNGRQEMLSRRLSVSRTHMSPPCKWRRRQ